MNKNTNILDCTLRDGGYYNNWDFKFQNIQKYLNSISSTEIKFVELGFRFLDKKKIRGLTAYTENNLIKKLKIPNNLNLGVMINAGDLLKNNFSPLQNCKKLFNKKNKKLKFVRLACHYEEIFLIKEVINWLSKNKFIVFVNLMQISEINDSQIIKVCNFLNKTLTSIFYFADSLGSLTPHQTKKISNIIKKNYYRQFGIHAHDNLGFALKNSLMASKNGASWIDSTITGMGRGPGNLKTEKILKYKNNYNYFKKNNVSKTILKFFLKLKKNYKWGTNKYYKYAAKNKIHPTYIQEILSDERYKKSNYKKILKNLKETESRKYNPFKLISPKNILISKGKGRWSPFKEINRKEVLIIGAGPSTFKFRKKIEKIINENNFFVIALNTTNNIKSELVNLRVASHPFRLLSDLSFYNSQNNLALPLSMLPKKVTNKISLKKRNIKDFGISINLNKKIIIRKNYCIMPNALAISYALAIAIAGKTKKIFFAGFDGYRLNDTRNDETQLIFKLIKQKYTGIKFYSITPNNYGLSNFE